MFPPVRISREESDLEVSILEGLEKFYLTLSEDQFSEFARITGFRPKRLLDIASRDEPATMSTLLRVAVFLEFSGISIAWGGIPEDFIKLIRLFAVSWKGLEFFIPDRNNRQTFLLYVRGKRGLPEGCSRDLSNRLAVSLLSENFVQMVDPLRKSLEVFQKTFSPSLEKTSSAETVTEEVSLASVLPPATQTQKEPRVFGEEENARARRFKNLVENLQGFADFYLAQGPEDRVHLREIAGQRGIFDCKNALAALCSEDAFSRIHPTSPESKERNSQ